jgi:hypothetical protein
MHPQVLALNNLKMEVKSETSDDSSSGSSSPTSSNSSSDSDEEEETSYWQKCRVAMIQLLRQDSLWQLTQYAWLDCSRFN